MSDFITQDQATAVAQKVRDYVSVHGFPMGGDEERKYISIIYPSGKGLTRFDVNPEFDNVVRGIADACGVPRPTTPQHIFVIVCKYPDQEQIWSHKVTVFQRIALNPDVDIRATAYAEKNQ